MARSRLRFALLALIPVLGLAVLAINRLREDSARLTTWLQELVLTRTGLTLDTSEPGRFSFWPELSLSLQNVQLRDREATVAQASSLAVSLPWSALRGDKLQLAGLQIGDMTVQGSALSTWWQNRFSSDLGPPQPWQWPSLSAPLRIHSLHWAGSSEANSWWLRDVELAQWLPDQPTRLQATFGFPNQTAAIPVLLVCTPRQSGYDLQLSPFALAIDPQVTRIEMSGTATFNHLHRVAFDGTLKTGDLSQRLAMDELDLERPSSLAVNLRGYWDGALRARALGLLFAETIDLDIGLPADWRSHRDPPMALLDVLEGQISLARLRLGASEWVRLSIEGKPLTESPATALPARPVISAEADTASQP